MRDEYDQINNVPKVAAEKTDIANVIMKIQVARQKESRGDNGGDHAGAVRGDLSAHDQAAANHQDYGAGSLQTGDQRREVGILFGDHILSFRRRGSWSRGSLQWRRGPTSS